MLCVVPKIEKTSNKLATDHDENWEFVRRSYVANAISKEHLPYAVSSFWLKGWILGQSASDIPRHNLECDMKSVCSER